MAFSTGCVATCNFLVLYGLMYRQLDGLELRRMLILLGKTAIAGTALAAVCAASTHWLLRDWATQTFARKAGELLGTVVAGGLAFAGCGAALRIEELNELIAVVKRRLWRAR